MGVVPEGEPAGTVRQRAGSYAKPPGKVVEVEVKSAPIPPDNEVRWSWWATVDRHPWSDKQGYVTEAEALEAAGAWVAQNYPLRTIVYKDS